MLAYFKDTSAKILRVQISKCTDAIPQATPQASPRKRPLVAEPRGGPLTTAQSAAPAAPKQRQKCMRQRKRYTHTPSRAVDTPTHTVSGCLGLRMYRLGLPDHWAARAAAPPPRRRRRATHTRVVATPRVMRHAYPPRRPPREESKDDDVVARNPIEARLLARERERKAKKPLTAKDLDNKMAEAEERRQLELEAIKFKGAQFSRPAPGPRRTVDYGEEKDSHK